MYVRNVTPSGVVGCWRNAAILVSSILCARVHTYTIRDVANGGYVGSPSQMYTYEYLYMWGTCLERSCAPELTGGSVPALGHWFTSLLAAAAAVRRLASCSRAASGGVGPEVLLFVVACCFCCHTYIYVLTYVRMRTQDTASYVRIDCVSRIFKRDRIKH